MGAGAGAREHRPPHLRFMSLLPDLQLYVNLADSSGMSSKTAHPPLHLTGATTGCHRCHKVPLKEGIVFYLVPFLGMWKKQGRFQFVGLYFNTVHMQLVCPIRHSTWLYLPRAYKFGHLCNEYYRKKLFLSWFNQIRTEAVSCFTQRHLIICQSVNYTFRIDISNTMDKP